MLRIDGKKVYLVPFEEKHLVDPAYYAWLTDFEVVRYIGRDEYLKPIQFEKVREYVEELWRNRYCSFFAMHHSGDDAFIGTAKINYLNEAGFSTRTADIGIMIGDRGYWGKGMATDALFAICNYAFNDLSARKLTAGAVSANKAVIRAFQKIGFLEEGRLRKKLLISGEYMDHVLLGCFREELHPVI
ncbi:acetyltransferase [Sulfuricaulis limicola]|uniref:Acetyltransferase n=1 Tax=Sulfuricaulis limicola TaxID=1620215 RepID=A0A1B4XFF6_9GAMM|nr:GNAT family protein [Sulfuricaulis limicola]BAV33530.1 acetyltransferase [Sulfuricaulis limicola]